MVHEVSDKPKFLRDVLASLNGATFLIVEPKLHVTKINFETVAAAQAAGFKILFRPAVKRLWLYF